MRTVCVLPSQSFASQMPALPKGEPRSRCEFICSYAQSKLVSPFGRDVAQRQRGRAPSLRELDLPQAKTEGAASYLSRIRQTLARTRQRAAPSVTACAVPPSSGKKAFLSCAQIKTEHLSILYLLMGVVDSLFCGKATPVATCIQHVAKSRLSNPLLLFSILRVKQKRVQICTLFFGGRWWIRTTEVVDNRFTVCPLWPLGKPPIFTCRNRGAGGRT